LGDTTCRMCEGDVTGWNASLAKRGCIYVAG
jgi:hypothetical protein